jgi:hypothetical protein
MAAVGWGAYAAGDLISPSLLKRVDMGTFGLGGNEAVAHDVDFSEEDKIAVAGGKPKKAETTPKAVKSSTGSVFTEGEAPVIVGDVPEGWRVETSNDIKVKFGPHKVPVGDDITFVVPVYTLVPGDSPGGVYIIEPGRTKEGHDEGGTLASVLTRLDSETQAVERALGSLSEAIAMLPLPEGQAVAEGGGEEAPRENDREKEKAAGKEGLDYRASVDKDPEGKPTTRATR